jgi:predicted DNA-binding transcriptional regulator AlpA
MARIRITDPEPLVSPKVVSSFLGGIAEQTLANWRSAGTGPPYHKLGGQVRYRITEVAAWVESQKRIPASA